MRIRAKASRCSRCPRWLIFFTGRRPTPYFRLRPISSPAPADERPFTHHTRPQPRYTTPSSKCSLPTPIRESRTLFGEKNISDSRKSPTNAPFARNPPAIDRFLSQNDILRGHRSGQSRDLRFCFQRRVTPPQCIGSRRHRPSGGAGGGVEPCPHWHKINIPRANANPPRPARSKPNERCVSTLAQTPFPLAQSAPTRLAALGVLGG